MKKLLFCLLTTFFTVSIFAQPTFNLGIKAGLNNSKITFKTEEYTSESILKSHIGAFVRLGFSIFYLQPEAYFSAKGANIESSLAETASRFNFNNLDLPILIGLKVFDGESFNARIMAGPVFSFVLSDDIDRADILDPQYFKDNYFGFQYGIGFDIWRFSLDCRMEHGTNDLYYHPSRNLNGKNQTFMVTAGFKIL